MTRKSSDFCIPTHRADSRASWPTGLAAPLEHPLNVVQIITGCPELGGAQTHVRTLSSGLTELGYRCTVLVGPPEGVFFEQLKEVCIPFCVLRFLVKSVSPWRDVAGLCELVKVLSRLKPDIVATHTAKAGFLGRVAALIMGIPCVFTPHGWSVIDRKTGRRKRLFIALERLGGRAGSRVINVCQQEKDLALALHLVDPEKISVVLNGVPDCPLQAIPERAPARLLMIARFEPQKDHATLLRALRHLKEASWKLRLAGSGSLVPAVKRMANDFGLADRIEFVGECSEPSRLYADSEVFVLSTTYEAFPITIIEAMRAGLPVVASDVGGISEAVTHGITGFLTPPRDEGALAMAIGDLVRMPKLRASLGAMGRTRYLECFTSAKMVANTSDVYASVLASRSNGSTKGSAKIPA